MRTRLASLAPLDCPLLALRDARLLAWSALWGVLSLLAFGLVSAIIPNPVFGRQIPPEPFAIGVWILSAPLIGLVLATYTVPVVPPARATPLRMIDVPTVEGGPGNALGTIGGLGAFLAIGCPLCNKVALVLLGASGALTVFAPLQPAIGAASLALLAGTLAWRLRLRALGGACPVR
jgi:hypothetical protein